MPLFPQDTPAREGCACGSARGRVSHLSSSEVFQSVGWCKNSSLGSFTVSTLEQNWHPVMVLKTCALFSKRCALLHNYNYIHFGVKSDMSGVVGSL